MDDPESLHERLTPSETTEPAVEADVFDLGALRRIKAHIAAVANDVNFQAALEEQMRHQGF